MPAIALDAQENCPGDQSAVTGGASFHLRSRR